MAPHDIQQFQGHNSIPDNTTILQGECVSVLIDAYNTPGPRMWRMTQHCFGKHFRFKCTKHMYGGHTHPTFVATVELFGPIHEDTRYGYRLEIQGRNHKLVWRQRVGKEGENSNGLWFEEPAARDLAVNGNLMEDEGLLNLLENSALSYCTIVGIHQDDLADYINTLDAKQSIEWLHKYSSFL